MAGSVFTSGNFQENLEVPGSSTLWYLFKNEVLKLNFSNMVFLKILLHLGVLSLHLAKSIFQKVRNSQV